ncbi:hypothetical protein BN946_scf185013.g14 [Trametes cinnabarina]|uniref:T6SS Phospholipase effector Tle1-like catalytic domain-containing protein n=1 Tax=Pycnoporus cinnabarinus TaxID=5643 RepID=A0A060SG86_PYCCI|nr:hypothetical protein BN946_scf185013.g14 [Trametes cinnabarina]
MLETPSRPPPIDTQSSVSPGLDQSPFSTWDRSTRYPSTAPTDSPAPTRHPSSSDIGNSDIIPPYHPARTLVLCFDGTGDQFNTDNSNIVTLFSLLMKDDRNEQMVYYQSGIGTYVTPQTVSPLRAKIDKVLDEMVAWNLASHVQGGYEFLMENYRAGDKICLFGFSRGAYTARALAGMIHKVGLLPAGNHEQVPFAYKMFARDDELGWKQSTAFKKVFSIDVDIDFIGVWDTVSSVGVIPHTLPFTSSNTAIRVFRHALSLDERRARFQANLYHHPSKADAERGTKPGDMPKRDTEYATRVGIRVPNEVNGKAKKPEHKRTQSEIQKQRQFERQFSQGDPDSDGQTDVLEVWFAGCHCGTSRFVRPFCMVSAHIIVRTVDVGGGSVTDDTPHTLARIPLRWMIRECFKTNTGIRFHGELLKRIGLNPAALHPIVLDRPPPVQPQPEVHLNSIAPPVPQTTEEEHEVRDALSPIYDQLSLAPYWWALELVKLRMEAKNLKGGPYTPKAQYLVEPIWVD